MKRFWDDLKIPLLCIALLAIGPTQCMYDNYIKWKIAHGVSKK